MWILRNNILILIVSCALLTNSGCVDKEGTYAEPNKSSPRRYVLATGSKTKTGVYYLLGQGIKAAVEDLYGDEIHIQVEDSNGSMENLERLEKATANFAFVQSNIADWFLKGEKIRSLPPKRRIFSVASLYTELIHIIARQDLEIDRIKGLKGRNVRTGTDPNAKFTTATDLLKAAGFKYLDVNEEKLSFKASREALLNGSIDAAFVTVGTPAPLVKELYESGKITFIGVSPEVARTLCKSCPYFVYDSIPAKTYGEEQTEEIMTVGVRALLVAHEGVPKGHVEKITEAIFRNTKRIREKHEQGASIRLASAKDGVTEALSFHQGSRDYFDRMQPYAVSDRLKQAVPQIVFGLGLIAIFITSYTVVSRSASKVLFFKLCLACAGFYTFGAIAMLFLEGPKNTHFSNLLDSFWSLAVYLVSGFEDRPPITTPGKITSITILLVVGVGFSGMITGNFASLFIKEKNRMLGEIKDHIVICNWNQRGHKVVQQLRQKEAARNKHIVIVADRDINKEELRQKDPKIYANVDFKEGNPESPGVLESYYVHLADSVIILADDEHRNDEKARDPDDRSISIALAIKIKIEEKLGKDESGQSRGDKPHVVAEIIDHRRIDNLKKAGVDETVCAAELGLGVLAQCAIHHNLSNVYNELLQYSSNTNEIYVVAAQKGKIPGKCKYMTFEEATELINNNRDPQKPIILLGVYRNNKIILNPKSERIEENDGLVVMAFSPPKMSYLAERKIRTAKPSSAASGTVTST